MKYDFETQQIIIQDFFRRQAVFLINEVFNNIGKASFEEFCEDEEKKCK